MWTYNQQIRHNGEQNSKFTDRLAELITGHFRLDQHAADANELKLAQTFTVATFIAGVSAYIHAAAGFVIIGMDSFLAWFCVAGGTVYLGSGLVLRRSRSFQTYYALTVVVALIQLHACVLVSGGAKSPALVWLPILLVITGMFMHGRQHLFYTVLQLGLLTLQAALILSGFEYYNEMPSTPIPTMAVIANLLAGFHIALLFMFDRLFQGVHERQLYKRARTDHLTGLLSRGGFEDSAEVECQRAHASQASLGLLVIDLDCFKLVNDTLGHATGDKLLQAIAQSLTKETEETGLVGRLGGDEFVVLIRDDGSKTLGEFARRLHHAACTAIAAMDELTSEMRHVVSVSIGVHRFMPDLSGQHYKAALAIADRALYKAKEGGKSQVYQI